MDPLIQKILSIIATAATVAAPVVDEFGNPIAKEVEAAALALTSIAQQAIAAFQQVTGKPIDLTTLQPIDPIA